MKKNNKGFTLIELLVVIAIIGLLSTLAVVALNNARVKSRDARRVSDIKQIQTALELYLNDQSVYPTAPAAAGTCTQGTAISGLCISDGSTSIAACSGNTYMASIPSDPLEDPYCYTRDSDTSYTIRFDLEGDTAGMAGPATHRATPAGMADD